MARRSLKPQLNQIRTWVRQGRTDAWIAHQLEVSVKDISAFKSEHDLAPGETSAVADDADPFAARVDEEEPDLRAADEALVAAALEAEQGEPEEEAEAEAEDEGQPAPRGRGRRSTSASTEEAPDDEDDGDKPRRRRRGRRGGRGRGRARKPLEGSFDHGDEGYGLWLDPALQDDPIYAEHWAGHRPVTVSIEPDRIVISRAGEEAGAGDGED